MHRDFMTDPRTLLLRIMLALNVVNAAGWATYLFVRWSRGTDESPISFASSTVGAVLALVGLGLTFSRYQAASGWILVGTSLSSTLFAGLEIEPDRAGFALYFLSVPVAVAALMISSRAGILTFALALCSNLIVTLARPELAVRQTLPPAAFLVYLSAILIVATYVKEKLDRIHEAKLAESAKMASLGQMSAGIAHEINNPLFVLNVSAQRLNELAEEEPLDREKLLDLARKVGAMTERIDQTVHSMKSFARDAAQDPFKATSLKDVLAETKELCRHRFAETRVRATFPDPPASLACECRPVQISQVLVNLLNNAIDAVASAPEKWVRVEVADQGSHVQVAVVDSGPGVPAEVRNKIMNPFFTTKPAGKGTGLGLSLSLAIARDHGGRLYLDGDSPSTRFVLELPKKAPVHR